MAATVVAFGFLTAGMSAALPFYAFDEFDSARVAGLFYTALGAGALVGSLAAVAVVQRVKPLRLAGMAILAFALPLWVLPFQPPLAIVFAALFLATLFSPLVNGPVIGVLTKRTPQELRAKVMTAVITVSTIAAPGGFLAAGQIIEHWGVVPVFTIVAAGVSLTALVFSFIVLQPRARPRRASPGGDRRAAACRGRRRGVSEDCVIRTPRLEDAHEFVRVHEAAWDAVGLSDRRLAELAPFEQRVQVFEDSLAQLSDDGHVWLAERDGAILGFISCTRGGDAAELRNLYVVPEAWGSGVGRALHDKAITWMRERQAAAILWVAEANARARRFYEREGWEAESETRKSPLGPSERRYRLTL